MHSVQLKNMQAVEDFECRFRMTVIVDVKRDVDRFNKLLR